MTRYDFLTRNLDRLTKQRLDAIAARRGTKDIEMLMREARTERMRIGLRLSRRKQSEVA